MIPPKTHYCLTVNSVTRKYMNPQQQNIEVTKQYN